MYQHRLKYEYDRVILDKLYIAWALVSFFIHMKTFLATWQSNMHYWHYHFRGTGYFQFNELLWWNFSAILCLWIHVGEVELYNKNQSTVMQPEVMKSPQEKTKINI